MITCKFWLLYDWRKNFLPCLKLGSYGSTPNKKQFFPLDMASRQSGGREGVELSFSEVMPESDRVSS
jgi:hypothetical protein